MSVQYVEVYQNVVTCLATGQQVNVRDNGDGEFILQGAQEVRVASMTDVLELLQDGQQRKHFAATAMNHRSSRAHTLFIVTLTHTLPSSNKGDKEEGTKMIRSQLHLVDLAGCEQIKKSKVSGRGQREAVGINSSLLVLGKVIESLVEERRHTPYFESKLTMLLKGAFGGNSRTTAVITASKADVHAEETVNALKFGERCANITNHTRVKVSNVADAVRAIDDALASCEQGMRNLEGRGKTSLPSYKKLSERHRQLAQKRKALPLAMTMAV